MFDYIKTILLKSQTAQGVFAGALAAAPVSLLLWSLRDVPIKIISFIKRQFSQTLVLISDMPKYTEFAEHAIDSIIWTRDYSVDHKYDDGVYSFHNIIGYGTHWGKYKGTYFILTKSLEESNNSNVFKEKTEITFITRKKEIIERFTEDAQKHIQKREEPRVYVNSDGYWNKMGPLPPRDFDTIHYDNKYQIIQEVEQFEKDEYSYMRKGLPYRKGILLYGEPGTGKTSIITALAHKLKRDIYYLNPNSIEQAGITDLMNGVWKDRLLVIEDIDVSGAAVDRDKESEGISLSELLNTLDGILSPYGLLTIATTNKLESLDPALVRSGRFDIKYEVGKLTEVEAQQMAAAFEVELEQPYTPMTGSDLRKEFLKKSS